MKTLIASSVLVLFLSGCTATTYNRSGTFGHSPSVNTAHGKGSTNRKVMIDASDSKYLTSDASVRHTYVHMEKLCAEPSPDTMSAIAQTLSTQLSAKDELSLSLQSNLVQTVATIGKRTETIQLLRDALYRVCEGYANGAIKEFEYMSLQRLYQQSMVSLLAIENLTQASDPNAVVLSAKSTMDGANSLHETWNALLTEKKNVSDAENNLKDAEKALSDGKLKEVVSGNFIKQQEVCSDSFDVKEDLNFDEMKKTYNNLTQDKFNEVKAKSAEVCKSLKNLSKTESDAKSSLKLATTKMDDIKKHYDTLAKSLGSSINSQVTITHPSGEDCTKDENGNITGCQVQLKPSYTAELIAAVKEIVNKSIDNGNEARCHDIMSRLYTVQEELESAESTKNRISKVQGDNFSPALKSQFKGIVGADFDSVEKSEATPMLDLSIKGLKDNKSLLERMEAKLCG